ncbi:MAG: hypothetical protein ACRCYU_10110 [Nocardioides sp.]
MTPNLPAWVPVHGEPLGCDGPLPLAEPFSIAQARGWGLGKPVIRQLLDRRAIRRVTQGVFVSAATPDTIEVRAQSLALVTPESAVVTDRTAAWLHGVPILPRTAHDQIPPISIYQRRGTRVRRATVVGGTRQLLDTDVMTIGGVQVTTPTRTAMDLGRLLWRFDALAALDGFARIGVPVAKLAADLDRFKGYRGIVQLRSLLLLVDGRSESPAESALRLHWYDAGLPRPELQWWVNDDHEQPIYRLDIALPDFRFAAEYDGHEFHSTPDQVEHDHHRRGWLASRRSWTMEVFTKEGVYGRSADASTRLAAAYARARRSPRGWTEQTGCGLVEKPHG